MSAPLFLTRRFLDKRAKTFLAAVMIGVLGVGGGASLAVALEAPPPLGPVKELQLPVVETYALPNGMKVTLVPFGNVPKATLSLRIQAGRLDEGDKVGVSDLTAALMNEGSAGQSPVMIARRASALGGEVGVSAGGDSYNLGIDVLSDRAADAVALLADFLLRPNFPASELPRLKQDMLRALAVDRNNPQAQAAKAFTKAFYGNHPFAVTEPTEAQVAALTLEDVRRFYSQALGAGRAHLYIAGEFDANAVRQAISQAFGAWRAGMPPLQMPPKPSQSLSVTLIDRPGAPQSTIYMGSPLPSVEEGNRVVMTVANELFGGTFTSRLMRNLREDKGYAYSPSSGTGYRYKTGQWLLSADVTTAHTGDSIREIFKELKALATTPPSEQELAQMQNSLSGTWVLRTAGRGGLIGNLQFYDTHNLPITELEQYLGKVHSVTPQEVSRAVRENLQPARMTLVIVGDLKQVRPQLQSIPELTSALAL